MAEPMHPMITRSRDSVRVNLTQQEWMSVNQVKPGFLPIFLDDREYAIRVLNIARGKTLPGTILSEEVLDNLSEQELQKYLLTKVYIRPFVMK